MLTDVHAGQDKLREVAGIQGHVVLQDFDPRQAVGLDHTPDEVDPLALWLAQVAIQRRRGRHIERQARPGVPHGPLVRQVLRVEASKGIVQFFQRPKRLPLPELPSKDAVVPLDAPVAPRFARGQYKLYGASPHSG